MQLVKAAINRAMKKVRSSIRTATLEYNGAQSALLNGTRSLSQNHRATILRSGKTDKFTHACTDARENKREGREAVSSLLVVNRANRRPSLRATRLYRIIYMYTRLRLAQLSAHVCERACMCKGVALDDLSAAHLTPRRGSVRLEMHLLNDRVN